MAHSYANIFMRVLDDFLSQYEKAPFVYYRYIDDIFMIWPHSVNELNDFLAAFNGCHESIKFTMDKSYQSLPYLDVLRTPPNGRNSDIDKFNKVAKLHLDNFLKENLNSRTADNLTSQEARAIRTLRSNKNIIIKRADKGGAITILNTKDYVREAEIQLSSAEFYQPLDEIRTKQFKEELKNLGESLDTKEFREQPTDNHQYLNFHSCHPFPLKKSIIFSQGLRIKRICSSVEDFEHQLAIFIGHLLFSDYPIKLITSEISKLSKYTRPDLLHYKTKPDNDRIPMVFDYHPATENLTKVLRNDLRILSEEESLRPIFSKPPLHGRRQTPNLKSMLTSSSLPRGFDHTGNFKCRKPRCQICNFINCEPSFRPPGNNFTIKLPNLTCDSHNVIYILYCTKCQLGNYVRETATPFRLRFNNNKKSIRDKWSGFPVAEHFNSPNHNIHDINCILVASGFRSTSERKKKQELRWILRLKSFKLGLNRDLGLLKRYYFVDSL
ncbi:hypothetical protein HOLleu_30622 [Holothuria leucospilota]|uniref:Helix-turn-helix domain-containing protein n=1 Tax=Holothuria leucospilota TaxID=206669 RepID=A0A9Q1BKM9_HOLLE|nr:hypothetical protein HOLleu_30622 [Holothuria leucospilota]